MTELLIDLLTGMAGSFANDLKMLGAIFQSPYLIAFRPEDYIGGIGGILSGTQGVLAGFGVAMLVAVFLKKGFATYVLWTDGDPDTDPGLLLIRFIQAIAAAVTFPAIYPFIIDIAKDITTGLAVTVPAVSGLPDLAVCIMNLTVTMGLAGPFLSVAYIICYIILLFQFFTKGVELYILRGGFCLACIGMLDSDRSLFTEYAKMFTKAIFTVIIQYAAFMISTVVLTGGASVFNALFALAFMVTGISVPKLLNQFLIPGGGGGGMQKVTSTMFMASAVRGFIRK